MSKIAKVLELIQQHQPKCVVEIGTWLGGSAMPIAQTIRPWGGKLVCVDPWLWYEDFARAAAATELRAKSVGAFEEFKRNIETAGVADIITPMRMTSRLAVQQFKPAIADFVYLDGAHDELNVELDLTLWWPVLKPGGIIAGDDYGDDAYPGVAKAWDVFAVGKAAHYENGKGRWGIVWITK